MKKPDNARKYLLTKLPSKGYIDKASVKTVRQGYLRKDAFCEAKVVEYVDRDEYFFIIKITSHGSGRESTKTPITREQFELLFEGTVGQRILKKRYEIKEGDWALNFDEFLDDTMKGKIIVLELEETSRATHYQPYQFPADAWTRDKVDVSDDPAFLNQNLAK